MNCLCDSANNNISLAYEHAVHWYNLVDVNVYTNSESAPYSQHAQIDLIVLEDDHHS